MQKIVVQLVSDVSGTEIADGKGETVAFALDGTQYEIDVTLKEGDKLRGALQDYIAVARKTGGGSRRKSSGSTGSGRTKEQLAKVREWAEGAGYEVNARGRIKQEIIDAYEAATK